jgi:hypothetical protein
MKNRISLRPLYRFAILGLLALFLCAKPASAVDLMVNGGFETGTLTPWVAQYGGCTDNALSWFPFAVRTTSFSSNGFGPIVTPRAGTRFVHHGWTCGPELASGAYYPANTGFLLMYQDVAVPAATGVVLSWSETLYTNLNFYPSPDWRCARPQNYRVEIRNTSNTVLQTLFTRTAPAYTTTNDNNVYTDHSVSLGATYAGQTIRVAFIFTIETGLSAPGSVGIDRVLLETLGPTASNVSISGQVLIANGRAPRAAFVTLSDLLGNTRSTYVDRAGRYQFTEVEAGQTYYLSVDAKGYTFSPPTRVVTPNFDVTELNFTAYTP